MLYKIKKSRAGLAAIGTLFVCLVGFAAAPALAQALRPPSDDELAVRSEDPTAPLMSFEVNDWYQASLYDKDGAINQAMFRSVIPFTIGSIDNLFRFTQQYTTEAYNNKLGGSDPEVV